MILHRGSIYFFSVPISLVDVLYAWFLDQRPQASSTIALVLSEYILGSLVIFLVRDHIPLPLT